MKLNKYLLGACAVAAAVSVASAQTVTLHGEVDYSTKAVGQSFTKTGDADLEKGNIAAGLDSDGYTKVDLNLSAANFEFNLGVKLNNSAGDEMFADVTDDYDGTPFYQGNMKIGFFNDQMKVYTGKFQGFNAGYVPAPVISDDPVVSYFASSGMGQHYTAIEASPYAVNGLKFIVGLPILPIKGNGVNNDNAVNQWKNLYKKINGAVAYTIPGTDVEISAGYRYGTYYTGVKAYDGDFTENYFGEAFAAAKLAGLVDGLNMSAVCDFRYRDGSYIDVNGDEKEHFTFALLGTFNAEINLIESLPMVAELNCYYANDDYMASDEKLLGVTLQYNTEYRLPDTAWSFGGNVKAKYAVDAMGTSGTADDKYFTNLTVCGEADAPAAGVSTNYVSYVVNPYAKYNLGNGAITLGAKFEHSIAKNDDATNSTFAYSIPVGIKFNF